MAEDLKACRTYCPVMQLESADSLCHEGNSWELALLTQGTRDAVAAAQTGKVSPEPPPHSGSALSPSQGGVSFPARHRAGHRQYTASTAWALQVCRAQQSPWCVRVVTGRHFWSWSQATAAVRTASPRNTSILGVLPPPPCNNSKHQRCVAIGTSLNTVTLVTTATRSHKHVQGPVHPGRGPSVLHPHSSLQPAQPAGHAATQHQQDWGWTCVPRAPLVALHHPHNDGKSPLQPEKEVRPLQNPLDQFGHGCLCLEVCTGQTSVSSCPTSHRASTSSSGRAYSIRTNPTHPAPQCRRGKCLGWIHVRTQLRGTRPQCLIHHRQTVRNAAAPSIFPHHHWAQLHIKTAHKGGTAQGKVNLSVGSPHLAPSSQQAALHSCRESGQQHRPMAVQPGKHPVPGHVGNAMDQADPAHH